MWCKRGHNRNACFFANDDCLVYLECLGKGCDAMA